MINKVVALPVLVASVTVHVAKGRRWSVVEHLLLEAVSSEPRDAAELAAAAGLPVRMVVEALINLMRVGWVELQTEKGAKFAATLGGRDLIGRDELPVSTRLVKRPVRYAIDRVSGSVLRYRELDFVWATRFRHMHDMVDAIIKPALSIPEAPQIKVINALLDEDEEYRGVVPSSARAGDGYALVSVINGKVRGLKSAPDALVNEVARVAGRVTGSQKEVRAERVEPAAPNFAVRSISTSPDDIILGGSDHEKLLRSVIANARAFVAVHSTFVGGGSSEEILALVEQAARQRGVKVDILWGKSDRINSSNETREACEAINDRMARKGLHQFVRAHPFSTDSHAKIIVADDGKGGFVGAIGSCNWLSTNFASFEVSLRATDPLLVSDMMEVCSQMARASIGLNSGIAAALAGQAINIRRSTPPRSSRRGEASVVLAPQHADFIRKARDDARRSIVIGSHRFGRSADNLSLTPTQAAVDANDIEATVYFGRLSDGITQEQAAELRIMHGRAGMLIRQVFDPRLHAKFLIWDDNDVLITSHNLLSADANRDYSEIGVHLRAPGVGRLLREKLETIFPQR